MSRAEQVFAEYGSVPEEDRPTLLLAANRASNMIGGRFSDNLRSEITHYQQMGRDRYLKLDQQAATTLRELGY